MSGPVLVVAAHPDDEALGCGGTIARWAKEGRAVHVLILADGETARADASGWACDDRKANADAAAAVLGCASVKQVGLPDNRMDRLELLDIVQRIEAAITAYQPESVLTHHAGDVNIDHRITHQAVVTACRPQPGHPVKELLFFEVPSSTEWQTPGSAPAFLPNCFVDVSGSIDLKLAALKCYESEMRPFPHPRSAVAVTALAGWRGATVGVLAAEAFIQGRRVL